tara:strand:- start:465 stop:1124 length:660 start_codon:yes stop_codon:yes gene_type:complete
MNLDINFDFDRRKRLGIIEAIFGEHKTSEQLRNICNEVLNKGEFVFITRIDEIKAQDLLDIYKNDARYFYKAKCLIIGENKKEFFSNKKVGIVAGGTSDLSVLLEAQIALDVHGITNMTFIDVGVAGIHRLMSKLENIKECDVIIVCAGMEGALPTVIGGLLPQPIIAVPVSVGYGVSNNGLTALNSMLSSCAPGISVMNIDNGYGAAMAALRILRNLE